MGGGGVAPLERYRSGHQHLGAAAVCERPLRERVVEEGEHHAQPAPPHLPHDLHVPLERALVLHVAAPAVLRGVVRHQPAPVDAEPEHLREGAGKAPGRAGKSRGLSQAVVRAVLGKCLGSVLRARAGSASQCSEASVHTQSWGSVQDLQAELDCEVDLRLRRRPEAQPLLRDWLVFPRLRAARASGGERR